MAVGFGARGQILMSRAAGRASGARWLWLSLGLLALDRATKFAIEHYTSPSLHHPIFSDVVVLVHSQNPGIAFGVFSDSNSRWLAPLLLLSATVIMSLLAWLLVTGRSGGRLAQCGVALILGGASGNALDRVLHGGVTDFLEVRLGVFRWPAFNVADSAISIGAVLILLELFFSRRHPAGPAKR
jgi:signal peptidase II